MSKKITTERIGQYLRTILTEIVNMGGEARLREVLPKVENKLQLTEYETATYEKSGYVRWISVVHFYSIDCVKAGYLQKKSGKWSVTPLGKNALKKSDQEFINSAMKKYKEWKKSKNISKNNNKISNDEDIDNNAEKIVRQAAYDEAKDSARQEIEDHIGDMNPYDFQDMIAELLQGMGYFVTFNAPPGPDGGIDLIAYNDPLGTTTPRIKIQVKQRASKKITVKEVRELKGLLHQNIDKGIIFSSGGFTSEAEKEMRQSQEQIELVDLELLIKLWCKYYNKISEGGKKLLPIVNLYFLAPTQE